MNLLDHHHILPMMNGGVPVWSPPVTYIIEGSARDVQQKVNEVLTDPTCHVIGVSPAIPIGGDPRYTNCVLWCVTTIVQERLDIPDTE